jgi:hypothetical protein
MRKRFYLLVFGFLLATGLASAREVIIQVAPPPPVRVGVVGVAPRRGYVWIEGYHAYRGGRYAWVPGRWARPPRPRAVWIPPHYNRVPRGWVFVPGHWRR